MSQSENEDLKSIFPAQGRGLGMVGDRVTFSESHFALFVFYTIYRQSQMLVWEHYY